MSNIIQSRFTPLISMLAGFAMIISSWLATVSYGSITRTLSLLLLCIVLILLPLGTLSVWNFPEHNILKILFTVACALIFAGIGSYIYFFFAYPNEPIINISGFLGILLGEILGLMSSIFLLIATKDEVRDNA